MDTVIRRIINMLKSRNTKIENYDLFAYGLKSILNYGIILLIVCMMSVFLHTELLTIVFIISFFFLRTYCGGFHFAKKWVCFLFSVLLLTLLPLMIEHIAVNWIIITIFCVLNAILIYMLSPIEYRDKQLSFGEKDVYKRKTGIHLSILLVIIFLFNILHVDISIIVSVEGSIILNFICMVATLVREKMST